MTVKEVQDLLKVERITVYRMLKDGRLTGVKIGHQWRFPRQEIDGLLAACAPQTPANHGSTSRSEAAPTPAIQALPIHCVQVIQNVFAEVAGVGAVTTDQEGEPLTEFSNSCDFCKLILSSDKGRRACIASFKRLAQQPDSHPSFSTCHAGLQYAGARIGAGEDSAPMLVAGQFYSAPVGVEEEAARMEHLAERYDLDARALSRAARQLPVLEERKQAQLGGWLQSVAHTFDDLARERAELVGRLRTIAVMSTLEGI